MDQDKKRILLVDDDSGLLDMMYEALTITGRFEVLTVDAPTRVLAEARAFKPDLMVLDVNMPGMDGGDVAALLSADPQLAGVPVMFLTSLLSKKEESGRQHGPPDEEDVIAKPITPSELIRHIDQRLAPG
jgi:CheY-like chemotaxis protein